MSVGISARIGIKSSFPRYMEALVSVYILWVGSGRPAVLAYGEEYTDSQNITKIRFTASEIELFTSYLGDSSQALQDALSNNVLVEMQLEPMQVGILNTLKIANLAFVDESLSGSFERKGGVRRQKKIIFSSVIDLFDLLVKQNEKNFKILFQKIVISLGKKRSDFDHDSEYQVMCFFVSFWAEQVKFRDKNEHVYESISNKPSGVDFHENGAARIVKALISNRDYYINNFVLDEGDRSSLKKRFAFFSEIYRPVYSDDSQDSDLDDDSSEVALDDDVLSDTEHKEIELGNKKTSEIRRLDGYSIPRSIPKNLLVKGVPGTGKSTLINNLIEKKLKCYERISGVDVQRVLRVNVHSASTNSALMQGVSVKTENGNIVYHEKIGLILNFLLQAITFPDLCFALVLEEVQENSLNSLIGDLIYLIEPSKRTDVSKFYDLSAEDVYQLVQKMVSQDHTLNYVNLPTLIESNGGLDKKIIFPTNLFVFCTSNYRDDRKIIEDNLLRRFDVIEIYPDSNLITDIAIKEFFDSLNSAILQEVNDTHADRFLIGHANWMSVSDETGFYRAFLKVIIEFKDIKDIDFSVVKDIMEKCSFPYDIDLSGFVGYKDLIDKIQRESGIFNF